MKVFVTSGFPVGSFRPTPKAMFCLVSLGGRINHIRAPRLMSPMPELWKTRSGVLPLLRLANMIGTLAVSVRRGVSA
jgi:hypothetical protein